MQTENVSTLKIHKLSQAQYDREVAAGNIDETALYLTPDEEVDLSGYATKEELNAKADASHNHNDLYYQQSLIDDYIEILSTTIEQKAGYVNSDTHSEIFNAYAVNQASGDYSHAEGFYTTASGDCSHAEGYHGTASGDYSHAEGTESTASGGRSHAEGALTTAAGFCSHTEGWGTKTEDTGNYAHAEGGRTTAAGISSHAEGFYTTASGDYSHAEGYCTTASDYQHASGKYNLSTTGPTSYNTQDSTQTDGIFLVGYGTSSTATANAFRISSGGKCFGTTSFGASGADFAELFEWADGNPNSEDRRGLFVTLDGEKIKLANAGDDYIGVISSAQAFIGNSASEDWQGKYLTDVFGAKLSQEVEVPAEIDEKTGEVITPATTTTQYVLNPDYDPEQKYVMRENRKEWGIVGLLGQIVMIDDGTCVVGGRIEPSENGIGTASTSGYRVMARIDENHVKVLVK